jgi:hypothetical protein
MVAGTQRAGMHVNCVDRRVLCLKANILDLLDGKELDSVIRAKILLSEPNRFPGC